MKTEKGDFRFVHSYDYANLLRSSDPELDRRGYFPKLTLESGDVFLIVSDHEPRGGGLQDKPCPGTVKAFTRHARADGRPLPWETEITYDPSPA